MKTAQKLVAITILLAPLLICNVGVGLTAILNQEYSRDQVEPGHESREVLPPVVQAKKSCSISGRLFGDGIQEDGSYYVVPSAPNRDESRSRMARIDSSNPSYQLSSLPAGRYVLRVFRSESGSLLPVKTFPRQREVNCTGSAIRNVDFEVQ
ncbi:hypothetical protein [Argonema galeatum]|uniref:hypothetical protein n=1 Tax=Argonema galeatum TaxID=2942762 RepID=UPI0020131883|nr:hypothetical protein [Argonema galeatum]MCL1467834.1 hypothetical protein [Argonema galeatum A003/A1]